MALIKILFINLFLINSSIQPKLNNITSEVLQSHNATIESAFFVKLSPSSVHQSHISYLETINKYSHVILFQNHTSQGIHKQRLMEYIFKFGCFKRKYDKDDNYFHPKHYWGFPSTSRTDTNPTYTVLRLRHPLCVSAVSLRAQGRGWTNVSIDWQFTGIFANISSPKSLCGVNFTKIRLKKKEFCIDSFGESLVRDLIQTTDGVEIVTSSIPTNEESLISNSAIILIAVILTVFIMELIGFVIMRKFTCRVKLSEPISNENDHLINSSDGTTEMELNQVTILKSCCEVSCQTTEESTKEYSNQTQQLYDGVHRIIPMCSSTEDISNDPADNPSHSNSTRSEKRAFVSHQDRFLKLLEHYIMNYQLKTTKSFDMEKIEPLLDWHKRLTEKLNRSADVRDLTNISHLNDASLSENYRLKLKSSISELCQTILWAHQKPSRKFISQFFQDVTKPKAEELFKSLQIDLRKSVQSRPVTFRKRTLSGNNSKNENISAPSMRSSWNGTYRNSMDQI